MRYRYFQPLPDAHGSTMLGYWRRDCDLLTLVKAATYREVFAEDLSECTLESIWCRHNVDSRPRAQEIRSMCVGDVVELDGRWWVVASVGFVPLAERPHVD